MTNAKTSAKTKWRFILVSLGIFVFLTCLGLTFLEIHFRENGQEPGYVSIPHPRFFEDTLKNWPGYVTDADGIFRVDDYGREVTNRIAERFLKEDFYIDRDSLNLEESLVNVIEDVRKRRAFPDGEFERYIQKLQASGSLSRTDSMVLAYHRRPINAAGFRSIAFDSVATDKIKVLLLGDSFTWGLTARPYSNCFADRLSARGYLVYNTGIIGGDPAQYLACARKFIPKLQPDVVIVNFYMGNDLMRYQRPLQPGTPLYHQTSGGWLQGWIDGCYVGRDAAYALAQAGVAIPRQDSSVFNGLCAKTVVGTRAWVTLERWGWVDGTRYPATLECGNPMPDSSVADYYVHKIWQVCNENETPMALSLIPLIDFIDGYREPGSMFLQRMQSAFYKDRPFQPVVAPDLDRSDYSSDDGHFNNAGMEKYADFLESVIDLQEASRLPASSPPAR